MHACMHTYIRTYVHTYIRTYVHTYIRTYVHTLHTLHTYVTYIHYIHTLHTYVTCIRYMHTLHAYVTYIRYIHTLHTYVTYIRYIHTLHTYVTYIWNVLIFLQYNSNNIPTLLNMEFEGGESYWNFILKFHFCNHVFWMINIPGKQMKIKYLSDWSSTCVGMASLQKLRCRHHTCA